MKSLNINKSIQQTSTDAKEMIKTPNLHIKGKKKKYTEDVHKIRAKKKKD